MVCHISIYVNARLYWDQYLTYFVCCSNSDTLDIDNLLDNMSSSRNGASSRRPPPRASRAPPRASHHATTASSRPSVRSSVSAVVHEEYEDHGGMDVGYDDYDDAAGNVQDVTEEPVVPLKHEEDMDVDHAIEDAHEAKPVVKQEITSDEGPSQQKISLTQTTKKLRKSAAVIAKEKAAAAAAKAQEGAMPLFKSDPSQLMGDMANGLAHPEGEKEKDINSVQVSSSLEREWWCKTATITVPVEEEGAAPTEQQQDYVPMYWTDATETNGIIYLFGRVAVVEPGTPKRFLSCCVAVHGSERNLFVLPKLTEGFKPDGTPMRAPLDKVYADVNKLLVPHVIPRSKGQGFRCKQVVRKYAFEHTNVPRGSCEYLKVVYSAKHGTPSPSQCDSPPASSSIERIFGATSTALEMFLLKRKLMGPSWILIKSPVVITDSVSWCKLELSIDVSVI
jgi:DNA polymerase alpha subunit A